MLNKSSANALAEVEPHGKITLVADFNGNPSTTVIVHYAPIEGDNEASEHYEQLANITRTIPKHNVLLVIGDCNAHLGPEDALYTFHQRTNNNGKLLLSYSQEANLVIANSRFQKKPGKLFTFVSEMNGRKSQIDYILINRKWKNSLKDCEAYSSFASVRSDHRVLSAKLRLSLRTKAATSKRENYDWSVLKSNERLQELYSVQLHNRYLALQNEDTDSITDKYQHFITANQATAKELVPKKPPRQKMKHIDDDRIKQARGNVQGTF